MSRWGCLSSASSASGTWLDAAASVLLHSYKNSDAVYKVQFGRSQDSLAVETKMQHIYAEEFLRNSRQHMQCLLVSIRPPSLNECQWRSGKRAVTQYRPFVVYRKQSKS